MIKVTAKTRYMLMVAGAIFVGNAAADPVTINVTGKVIAAACTIDNNGKYDVDLGQNLSAVRLNSATPYSEWKTFNVTLSQCPAGTTKVTARFSGIENTARNDMYANAAGDGYAKNIAIELQRTTGGVNAGNGKALTVDVDSLRKATFDLQARVYGIGGATPGNIASVVTLDFAYN